MLEDSYRSAPRLSRSDTADTHAKVVATQDVRIRWVDVKRVRRSLGTVSPRATTRAIVASRSAHSHHMSSSICLTSWPVGVGEALSRHIKSGSRNESDTA